MTDIADDIMDNACLPQAFYQNGVDASIRAAIRDAIRDAVAEKDDEIERLRSGGLSTIAETQKKDYIRRSADNAWSYFDFDAEVAAAVLAEREACAKIADERAQANVRWVEETRRIRELAPPAEAAKYSSDLHCYNLGVEDCKDIAAAIRTRTGKE